jgi:hypothetical protein
MFTNSRRLKACKISFFDQNKMKSEISRKKGKCKHINRWKFFNNILLNNQWIEEEITEFRNYTETNEIENTTF